MPHVSLAAHIDMNTSTQLRPFPADAGRDALAAVARRLLGIADNPATQWSEAGRAAARKAAHEMLQQAGEPKPWVF